MIYRIYRVFLALSIISCALSVSLSQLFLAISLVFFLFLKEKPSFRSSIVQILFLFYGWQFFGLLYHFIASGFETNSIKLAFGDELKDIFLVSAFFVIQGIKVEDRKFLHTVLIGFALTILFTGFFSIFSMTRLSRIISDLYKTSASWPYQHHYGDIFNVSLYLPIGFMNTHLTFGGLLMFVYPGFLFRIYESWKNKDRKLYLFLHIVLFFMISAVFLFNNARSSLLGAFFSILLGLYCIVFIDREISLRFLKRIGIFVSLILLIGFLGYQSFEPIQKVIRPLFGGEKHTDSGRSFIWNSTYPLIEQNPIFGIGAGKYKEKIEESRKQLSTEQKELSFFYEVTQRGHAHNDYLHLMSIFGIPQVVFYLFLCGIIIHTLLSLKIPKNVKYVTYGLSGFFFSGLLQCYFQDDEVLIVFMFLLGYLNLFLEQEKREV